MSFVSSLAKASFPTSDGWHSGQGRGKVNRNAQYKDHGYNPRQFANQNTSKWYGHSYNITCKWELFREQILMQWNRLIPNEVDAIGPDRSKLALLIENKYGIAAHLVENYLRNFERTLPLI